MSVLRKTYQNYNIEGLRTAKAERRLFTEKELRIIRKILDVLPLSPLEANRYSRTIKPKVNAIIDLYDIAVLVRSKE
ncbi:MAG: hypothetical protein V1678_01050 [Candidatus Aenigmatarchaeota archaeon]